MSSGFTSMPAAQRQQHSPNIMHVGVLGGACFSLPGGACFSLPGERSSPNPSEARTSELRSDAQGGALCHWRGVVYFLNLSFLQFVAVFGAVSALSVALYQ